MLFKADRLRNERECPPASAFELADALRAWAEQRLSGATVPVHPWITPRAAGGRTP
jgi:hypothetical protein